jgi:3-phosphoglycerate kinase
MFSLKSLTSRPDTWWQGKTVVARLDLNVPITNGAVSDDYRITRAWPTVQWLLARAGKLVLLSHADKGQSLASVAKYLQQFTPVTFVSSISEAATSASKVVLLENLRLLGPGEEAHHLQKCSLVRQKHSDGRHSIRASISITVQCPTFPRTILMDNMD